MLDIEVRRTNSSDLIVQTLPDGSTAIFEVSTKNVYSLNQSAAAAWEACTSAGTLSQIATVMSRRLDGPVSEDLAREAVSELAAVGLVTVTPGESPATSRREMLKVAGVGLPVVLVLTGVEQRAHAQSTASPPPGTTPPPQTTVPPQADQSCESFLIGIFSKGVDEVVDGTTITTPLAGAVFTLYDPFNNVVATLTTDQNGQASYTIKPAIFGTYRLVEDHLNAPGGPYLPFSRDIVVDRFSCSTGWVRDLHNTKAS